MLVAVGNGPSFGGGLRITEGALLDTLDKYVDAFRKVSTPFFQERVYDIKDVFHRLLWHLRSDDTPSKDSSREAVVLIAHEASVMELFAVDPELRSFRNINTPADYQAWLRSQPASR